MKKFLFGVAGVFIMLVGIAGLVLPILPGWVLIFFGLSLISPTMADRLRHRVWRKFFKQDVIVIEGWSMLAVRAGLTTKHFPMKLSKTDELLPENNQLRFKTLLNGSKIVRSHKAAGQERFVFLNQVHGDQVEVLDDESAYSRPGFYHLKNTDAVITRVPGLSLLVMTADCLPIFFYAKGWAGLAHAGWRGTQKEIALKTLNALIRCSGAHPRDVCVAFGPSISVDHYEVGPEFRGYFTPESLRERDGKLFFNLSGENRRQLLGAGVLERHLVDLHICTVDENSDFYSYRREHEAAGRMVSFIMLR